MSARFKHGFLAAAAVGILASIVAGAVAAELAVSRSKSSEGVDIFQAIDAKQIEVKFVPSNDKEAHIMIKNLGDQPLTVKVPGAFAGVPVLAQAAARPANRGAGGAAGGAGGQNQGLGGGLGGGGGGGGGGAAFNIAPEKVATLKAECVCLDHGKPDPNPRVEYEIKPIDSYATDPAVGEVVKLMADGKVSQRVAQIAAWHLNNHMTFEQLSAEKIKHLRAASEPMFTAAEIKQAVALVTEAQKNAEANKAKTNSTVKSGTASAQ